MKRKLIANILKGVGAVSFVLVVILGIHIYKVTRPPKADETTISLARIDFQQELTKADSVKITQWLYQQKGVEHVLCNTESKTAVFSFYPVKTNATALTKSLVANLSYKANRFMPSKEAMQSGCPAKY